MSLLGPLFFMLGLGACYVIGLKIERLADLWQGAAIGLCGVAGVMFGLPTLWADQFLWALGLLFVYGILGSIVFRMGRRARED